MDKNILVMIPGPTPVADPIRAEMARPIQAFGDPRFVADYKKLIDRLGRLMHCDGQCFPLAGTGTLAMEMAISNAATASPISAVEKGSTWMCCPPSGEIL